MRYLLDTNIVIGILANRPEAVALTVGRGVLPGACAYSAITRMELLGFPGIAAQEANDIEELLSRMVYLPLTGAIEDVVISLRRLRKVKLPDAIIAATASVHSLELISADKDLCSLAKSMPT